MEKEVALKYVLGNDDDDDDDTPLFPFLQLGSVENLPSCAKTCLMN